MTVFLFTAKDGRIDLGSSYNKARFHDFLMKNEGKEFRIEKIVRTRSTNQNKFYWFYLRLIERETGNNSTDLHEYLKRALLPPRIIKVLGKEVKIAASTTKLNKNDFGEYLDKICALTEIPIPDYEAYKKWAWNAGADDVYPG